MREEILGLGYLMLVDGYVGSKYVDRFDRLGNSMMIEVLDDWGP